MAGPNPHTRHPLALHPRVGFLKPLVDAENVEIGEYTYYDDPEGPKKFVEKCVLYHYPFLGDRLIVGKFCAIAEGVRFIMNGANHDLAGFSTYPFNIFGEGWEEGFDTATWCKQSRGDIVIGNDVWIGLDATFLPGVKIGDGAIIAAGAVVAKDVPPYAVAVGNSARVVKKRFDDVTIERLVEIAWWNWPADKISRNLDAIRGADLKLLEDAA